MCSSSYKNNTLKSSHSYSQEFSCYLPVRFAKCLLTNMQKQQNVLKILKRKRKIETLRVNNSRILSFKNAKFSGYHFYRNLNIQTNFQICISVPLINITTMPATIVRLCLYSFFVLTYKPKARIKFLTSWRSGNEIHLLFIYIELPSA